VQPLPPTCPIINFRIRTRPTIPFDALVGKIAYECIFAEHVQPANSGVIRPLERGDYDGCGEILDLPP
jgi:hypothetical protein